MLAVDAATICLVNRAREKRRLPALRASRALDAAARLHSHEMRVNRFFAHVTPAGQTPLAQMLAAGYGAGASGLLAAQCIAWGSGSYATPRGTVLDWLGSPAHRALLLSRGYSEIGVGASLGNGRGGSSGALYTADLARRRRGG